MTVTEILQILFLTGGKTPPVKVSGCSSLPIFHLRLREKTWHIVILSNFYGR